MKRTLIAVLALSVLAAACGDDDDDNLTGPSNSNRPVFTAQLLPANEIPTPAGPGRRVRRSTTSVWALPSS
jgi:hypothetical protein